MGTKKKKKCECCGKEIKGQSITLVGEKKNYTICNECWRGIDVCKEDERNE